MQGRAGAKARERFGDSQPHTQAWDGTAFTRIAPEYSALGVTEGCDYIRVRLIPERVPLIVGAENAQLSDLIGVGRQPGSTRFFEPGVEDMTMAGFDESRADR